jgi:hypothetical protein
MTVSEHLNRGGVMISITQLRVPGPGLVRRPHQRRYLGVAAVTAVLLGTLGTATAMADPTASVGVPAPGAAASETISGVEAGCAYTFKWDTDGGRPGGWTEVEWTNNPCGLKIQDRTYCESNITLGDTQYVYSGVVTRTGLWDRATCGITWTPAGGQDRHTAASGSWGSWTSY